MANLTSAANIGFSRTLLHGVSLCLHSADQKSVSPEQPKIHAKSP